jgi:hypothetical protein
MSWARRVSGARRWRRDGIRHMRLTATPAPSSVPETREILRRRVSLACGCAHLCGQPARSVSGARDQLRSISGDAPRGTIYEAGIEPRQRLGEVCWAATRSSISLSVIGTCTTCKGKTLYAAVGEPNNRNRRPATLARAIERLMVLDAVLADRRLRKLASVCSVSCCFYYGGEGGIRSRGSRCHQRLRPDRKPSNHQIHSKPEYQVQNKYGASVGGKTGNASVEQL